MDDEETIERIAMEELLQDAKRGAERAKEMGSLGWQKSPVPPANKRFLSNMLVGTMRHDQDRDFGRRDRRNRHSPDRKRKHDDSDSSDSEDDSKHSSSHRHSNKHRSSRYSHRDSHNSNYRDRKRDSKSRKSDTGEKENDFDHKPDKKSQTNDDEAKLVKNHQNSNDANAENVEKTVSSIPEQKDLTNNSLPVVPKEKTSETDLPDTDMEVDNNPPGDMIRNTMDVGSLPDKAEKEEILQDSTSKEASVVNGDVIISEAGEKMDSESDSSNKAILESRLDVGKNDSNDVSSAKLDAVPSLLANVTPATEDKVQSGTGISSKTNTNGCEINSDNPVSLSPETKKSVSEEKEKTFSGSNDEGRDNKNEGLIVDSVNDTIMQQREESLENAEEKKKELGEKEGVNLVSEDNAAVSASATGGTTVTEQKEHKKRKHKRKSKHKHDKSRSHSSRKKKKKKSSKSSKKKDRR